MFRVSAHTDIGPRKKTNQDSCCAEVALTPHGSAALLAVCDGVGGLASGELASASTVEWLVQWFETVFSKYILSEPFDASGMFDQVQRDWEQGLYKMNDALRAYGRKNDAQLGTTCTAILLVENSYIIVHVGDSRVYRFSHGHMEILTTDQTWVAQEVARGNIPPERARFHPKRNVILQSVGTQSDLQPVFYRGSYCEGDTFMLCCDGFRNELFDDELIDAFGELQQSSESAIHESIAQLISLVLNRGERDNISAVVCSVQPGEEYDSSNFEDDSSPTRRFDNPDDSETAILAPVDSNNGSKAGE